MSNKRYFAIEEKKDQFSCDQSLFGAFEYGTAVEFLLKLTGMDKKIAAVTMVIHADGWDTRETVYRELPLDSRGGTDYGISVDMGELCETAGLSDNGLFYYHYRVDFEDGDRRFFGGEVPTELAEINGYDNERQLSVFAPGYTTSDCLKEGMIYHIFVDRFKRSQSSHTRPLKDGVVLDENWENGIPQYGEYPGAEVANNVFFGGDLDGIAEELPYIRSLGVSTIYLSPVFDAASNHKYDTGDYLTVDKMFGGDEALRRLCEEAKRFDIRILLDGVFNHTGSDSVYFNRFGRYDSLGAYQSEDSPFAPWYSFTEFPEKYECWWGVKILPRVDTGNEEYQRFIYDEVIDKWTKAGVSHWRLDVADELNEDFLVGLRTALKERNPDGALIGEVWEDASDKVSYGSRRKYLRGHQLDSVMNYPLRDAIISYVLHGDSAKFRKNTESLYRRYPKQTSDSLMNFLGTHDTVRILSVLGDDGFDHLTNAQLSARKMTKKQRTAALRLLKLAFGILVAVPGVPCIFYGDEVGMEGYRDPFCRKPFPWHAMDEDLLAFYRKMGDIRTKEPVFRDGLFRLLSADGDCLVIERTNGRDTVTIVVNRSERDISYAVPSPALELISGRTVKTSVSVKRRSVVYLKRL